MRRFHGPAKTKTIEESIAILTLREPPRPEPKPGGWGQGGKGFGGRWLVWWGRGGGAGWGGGRGREVAGGGPCGRLKCRLAKGGLPISGQKVHKGVQTWSLSCGVGCLLCATQTPTAQGLGGPCSDNGQQKLNVGPRYQPAYLCSEQYVSQALPQSSILTRARCVRTLPSVQQIFLFLRRQATES